MPVKSTPQKIESTRQLVHSLLELRDELRQFMQRKFKQNNINLTYEMHQVMACLWRQDGINQQEIADRTLRDKASITFLIDNLSKRNLVKRQEDPTDRRSKRIILTARGKRLGETVKPWVEELFTVSANGVNATALKQCIETMKQMCDNVRKA